MPKISFKSLPSAASKQNGKACTTPWSVIASALCPQRIACLTSPSIGVSASILLILVWQCSSTRFSGALSIRCATSSFMIPRGIIVISSKAKRSGATLPIRRSRIPGFNRFLNSLHSLRASLPSRLSKRSLTKMPLVSSLTLKVSIIAPVRSSCSMKVCRPPSLSKLLTKVPSITTLFSSSVSVSILRTLPLMRLPHKRPSSFLAPYSASFAFKNSGSDSGLAS